MPTTQDTAQKTTTKRRRTTKKAAEEPQAPQDAAPEPETAPDTPSDIFVSPDMQQWPLARKLAWIMAEIGNRKPEGKNDHFRYKYYTDAQLSGIFQPRFAKFGIMMLPRVQDHEVIESKTAKGGLTWITNLQVRYDFIDGFTGETLYVVGFGQGDDPGDKGSNKAMTGATKYTLLKTFLIGSEADAEMDSATDERHDSSAPVKRTERRGQIQQSSSTGEVKKGGRQVSGTDAQVNAISVLAAKAKIGVSGMPNVVKNALGIEMTLSDDPTKSGPELRAFLGSLKSDDLGKLVQVLQTSLDRSEQLDKDFDKAEDIVRQDASGEENQDA